MSDLKLSLHGNLGNFENPRRFAKPEGLIGDSSLVLKLYNMYSQHGKNPVEESKEFLKEKIKRGEIEALSGLGFAILSKDMLNINRWDWRYPIVVKNEIWEYDPKIGLLGTIERVNINETGPYCVWELGIVNHEKNAWLKYLDSKMMEEDKIRYINDFIEGDLK